MGVGGPAGGGKAWVRPRAREGGPITGHKVPDLGGTRAQATEDLHPVGKGRLYPRQWAGLAGLRLTRVKQMSPALPRQVTMERG